MESARAAIKRIQSKACGLFDMEYLFLKMRQVHFMRLQRLHSPILSKNGLSGIVPHDIR